MHRQVKKNMARVVKWCVAVAVTGWSSLAPLSLTASPARFRDGTDRVPKGAAIEAEFFTVESGWDVMFNGEGNYMVDIIGFQHIGGERLLAVDEKNSTAHAYHDVEIPADGDYRLLVRYEYPPFSEARFEVSVTRGRRTVASMVMGKRDNPRFAFNDPEPSPQYDPPWGAEGMAEEALNLPGLRAGAHRIHLKAVEQPQIPGVTAGRHIDFVYISDDMTDSWRSKQSTRLYPILDVFRHSVGPRWEARVRNRGDAALNVNATFQINREPWGANEGAVARGVAPGEWSDWRGLRMQDTTHFHNGTFSGNQEFDLELRPIGPGSGATTLASEARTVRVYMPPYGRWNETPIRPEEQIERVLALLRDTPAPGREPTLPLTYGGWLPVGTQTTYNRKYAELYKTIGMRGFPSTGISPDLMRDIGLEPNQSYMVLAYRNHPIPSNIQKAKEAVTAGGFEPYLKWYDYGDEIHFSEWVTVMLRHLQGTSLADLWKAWLAENRPGFKAEDYWLSGWGAVDANALRPESSASTAEENPRLFVDSTKFYQQAAIDFVANGLKDVKSTLGNHVLGGANYSVHPYYYPLTSMYVHWFRGGAADFGRHSEYFWQCTQPGPMINGYVLEHFRAGMRDIPHGIIRQYTMPHVPGNTDASFRRTAFSHLAHGAKMLDYFGIGMNECFTENHIDHRHHDRYLAIRDINYSIGMIEDVLEASSVVPSRVAILLSDSTERWDMAPLAADRANHMVFDQARFRQLRLVYHLDRVGLWKALTFAGESPDLIVEEDLNADILDNYSVLYVVGENLPPEKAAAVQQWVNAGGVLVATATAGQTDGYLNPSEAWFELLGISKREYDIKDVFARPRQELPFLEPYDQVVIRQDDEETVSVPSMPSLAVVERFEPLKTSKVIASFEKDGKPAVIHSSQGKGQVLYIAAFPGVAYLWQGLQPAKVPDRGVNTHTVPSGFDQGARALITMGLEKAGVTPRLDYEGRKIDARLIRSGRVHVLPIADYDLEEELPLTVTVNLDQKIGKVSSAFHGEMNFTQEDGRVKVALPSVKFGDILRFDP